MDSAGVVLDADGVGLLKLVQLRKELQDRGLEATGSKQELVRSWLRCRLPSRAAKCARIFTD